MTEHRVDTGSAHAARIYDYILGGDDHYPADREAGDGPCAASGPPCLHMRANRDFTQETLDLSEPVALTVIAIVHFMLDDAVGIVRRLLEPLPSGSCLAMSVGTADFASDEVGRVPGSTRPGACRGGGVLRGSRPGGTRCGPGPQVTAEPHGRYGKRR